MKYASFYARWIGAVALLWALFSFPQKLYGADPWDMAFAAKEQILLGNHRAAERLLKLVQSELAHQDKNDLDWELFKWTETEIKKVQEQLSGNRDPMSMPAPMKVDSKPWYKSHWVWIGGAAAVGLWVHHEKSRSRSQQVTEGFHH